MTEDIEQPVHKNQWTILYSNALGQVKERVAHCRTDCAHLEIAITRSKAESIFTTPIIPKPIEPLQPISERATLPDGTGIISITSTLSEELIPSESDKQRELKSELELARGKKFYIEEELANLQKLELADTATKEAWIQQTVDQFFQKVLGDYTAYLVQKAEDIERRKDPEVKVHKQTLTNNAVPSLLALVLFPHLCTDPNRDRILALFIDENKPELTIAKYKVAEMMLDQARQLGLLPNSAEAIDQQDRQLASFLQKINT